MVQFMPSGDVIILSMLPEIATATNNLSSGDHSIARQLLSFALLREVQDMPSGEVITRSPLPELDTAAKSLSSGDQYENLTIQHLIKCYNKKLHLLLELTY